MGVNQGVPSPTIGAWLTRPVPRSDACLRRVVPARIAAPFVRRYVSSLPAPAADVGDESALEVFLRVAPRDLSIAPLALASLRRHLTNRIVRTVVATPTAHVAEARRLFDDVDVVSDEEMLPASLWRAIAQRVRVERANWVGQQFLSLVHVSARASAPCLVWDADTVMIRSQTMLRGKEATLAISREHHPPYFELVQALLPTLPLPAHSSTVAHHMVMDPDLLRALFVEIEQDAGGEPWWSAILNRLDREEASPMSEYELYGQWVRTRCPERVRLVAFRNIALSRGRFTEEYLQRLSRRQDVDSVSTHWWIPEGDA